MDKHVLPVDRGDIGECARLLAEGFAEDPVMCSIWPEGPRRHKSLRRYFATSLRHNHVPHGGVQRAVSPSGELGGVAVWDPPGTPWIPPALDQLRSLAPMLAALGGGTLRARAIRSCFEAHHPATAHWYLASVATAHSVRGAGFATALISNRLAQCDNEATPAYLVCTRESNIAYYTRFGFVVNASFRLPTGGGPTMWGMWRPPRE